MPCLAARPDALLECEVAALEPCGVEMIRVRQASATNQATFYLFRRYRRERIFGGLADAYISRLGQAVSLVDTDLAHTERANAPQLDAESTAKRVRRQ